MNRGHPKTLISVLAEAGMLGDDVEISKMDDYSTSLKTTAKLMIECARDIRIALRRDTDASDCEILKSVERLEAVASTLLLCLKK